MVTACKRYNYACRQSPFHMGVVSHKSVNVTHGLMSITSFVTRNCLLSCTGAMGFTTWRPAAVEYS